MSVLLAVRFDKKLNDCLTKVAKANNITKADFIRRAVKEQLSLLAYLNDNCDYMDETEQEEIEALNIDFEDLN